MYVIMKRIKFLTEGMVWMQLATHLLSGG